MKQILFAIIPFVLLTVFSSGASALDYRSLRDDEMAKYKNTLIVYKSLKALRSTSRARLSETAGSAMIYKLNSLYYYIQNVKLSIEAGNFSKEEKNMLMTIISELDSEIKRLQEKAKSMTTQDEAISLSVEIRDTGGLNLSVIRLYAALDNRARAVRIADNLKGVINTAEKDNGAIKLLDDARTKYRQAFEVLNLSAGLSESQFRTNVSKMYALLSEGNLYLKAGIKKVREAN